MDDQEMFGVATLLLSRLRRHINRHFDIVWFLQNQEYAREVLRIARSFGDEDIARLAARLEGGGVGARGGAAGGRTEPVADAGRYVGSLR